VKQVIDSGAGGVTLPGLSGFVSRLSERLEAVKVPEITAWFWLAKLLSTALGESTSDFLVHRFNPFVALSMGAVGFVLAMAWQLSKRTYTAVAYWLAVAMVGVTGTMAADALHVGIGVPYLASTVLFAAVLAAVFAGWQRSEGTLSIHSIMTLRRELFYWAAVCATFALGTAAGDMTATTLHLGYLGSALVFLAILAVPAVGYWKWSLNAIGTFWAAYVVTRPVGASFADYMGRATNAGGLGWGPGIVAFALAVALAVVVLVLAVTKVDTPAKAGAGAGAGAKAKARAGAKAGAGGSA
jgi:uncharacterized membrane-anchored protein